MNRIVNPEGLPEQIGFSHAVESEGRRTLYVAGQIGETADGEIAADLVGQFRQALRNVAACLEDAGYPVEALVRLEIYTTDVPGYRQNLKELGAVWREVFGRHYPAIALFGVTELFDPRALIEVVATASL